MTEDLVWTASKISQFLEKSPYILDFKDFKYFDKPILAYKNFIIYVESEKKIIIGIQPCMDEEKINILVEKLRMIIDEVEIKRL